MKIAYLRYRKGLLKNRKERFMNLGDPFQSFAIYEALKRIGYHKEEIMTIDRYDVGNYCGEPCVLIVNGAENYEYYMYSDMFFPRCTNIIPIYTSLHINRPLREFEIESLRFNQPVGCRDEETMRVLTRYGIHCYLSGCITLTLPKREEKEKQNKVFFIDIVNSLREYIPAELSNGAIELTQIVKMRSRSKDSRITEEETTWYNETACSQLSKICEEARLVVTSRLHIASPCLAMGVPVILAKDAFDTRFQFIDRFLPLYTPEQFNEIDWDPVPVDLEDEKQVIIDSLKNRIDFALNMEKLSKIYQPKLHSISFQFEELVAAKKLPFKKEDDFRYAIWGVALPNSYQLFDSLCKQFSNSQMITAIDTYCTGTYRDNIPIITPGEISGLPDDVIILVIAPAAHSAAVELLSNTKRPFALIKGTSAKLCNFVEKCECTEIKGQGASGL